MLVIFSKFASREQHQTSATGFNMNEHGQGHDEVNASAGSDQVNSEVESSPARDIDVRTMRRSAADAYDSTAKSLERIGFGADAERGYEATALLDLEDDELQQSWGGPFNGQLRRAELFRDIVARANPQSFVETGAYRATTTLFVAENFGGRIFTCEIDRRFYLQCCRKLSAFPSVEIDFKDSRNFLRELLSSERIAGPAFFYLDAHWQEDLPLREEIDLILAAEIDAVI